MPGKVKVKIISGKDLPVMDRSNDTTDAYVEVKLGSTTFKTDVCRKSLNPQWDSEWFRFEMDDLELQDEPLQIRLMDHDTYSANDAIGKVYLDLNPLLLTSSKSKDSSNLISGWIPVYDTMHGIRGEVLLIVKVELFSDLNKFRQSSCGVKFFFTQAVPDGYFAHSIHGFVEELVVNDDPEYQWIDKIRTPRASNEARQTLFSKLSGEVQRRVGLKALELGGNAVIGYRQCFDLEGESGIVVRGIGTAATLTKQFESQLSPSRIDSAGTLRECQSVDDPHLLSLSSHPSSMLSKTSRSNNKRTGSHRVPTSTHSMPETILFCNDTNTIDNLASITSSTPKLPHRLSLKHESSLPVRLTNSAGNFVSECLMLNVEASPPRHTKQALTSDIMNNAKINRNDNTTNTSPLSKLTKNSSLPLPFPPSMPNTNDPLVRRPLYSSQLSDNNYDSLDNERDEVHEKVKFETGAESLSSLTSGVDTDMTKVYDSMEEGGNDITPERRKLMSNDSNLSVFLVPRKPRGSKKKDKYSKSSLLKRASMNFADSKKVTDGKEKFTNEIVKFFKKKKTFLGDKDDTSSLGGESSTPYRQPKSCIFRRRQKFHGNLHRCNSENFSLGETSLDSLPSIQSELVFDPDDDTDSNSLESLPRNSQCSPIHVVEIPAVADCGSNNDIVSSDPAPSSIVAEVGLPCSSTTSDPLKRTCKFTATNNVATTPAHQINKSDDTTDDERWIGEGLYGNKLADAKSTSIVIKAMKELGYGMEKPLNLYISSADALLVYEPSNATDTTNNTTTENTKQIINKSQYVESGDLVKGADHPSCCNSSSTRISTVDSTCSFTSTSTSNMTNNSSSGSGFGCQNNDTCRHSPPPPPVSKVEIRRGAFAAIGRGPLAGYYNSQSSKRFGVSSYHSRSLSDSGHGMGQWRSSSDTANNSIESAEPRLNNNNKNNTTTVDNETTAAMASSSSFAPCDHNCNGSASVHDNRKVENGPPYVSSHRSPIPEETSEKSCSPHNITASIVNAASNTASNTTTTTTTTTTTNTFTSNATVSNAIVHVSLSSHTNASSTNLTPAPRVTPAVRNTQTTCYTTPSVGVNRSATVSSSTAQNTVSSGTTTPSNKLTANSPAKVATTVSFINRRSSESDLCTPPKPISTTATTMTTILASSTHGKTLTFAPVPHRRLITADHFEMLEYPFITLNQLPHGFIQHLGGTVSARSVKLLERISNLDEPESRDSWWTEIRMEIRSHARAIGCNVVLGYEEQTTMCDDVCVLSASGTAAVVSSTGGEAVDIVPSSVTKLPGGSESVSSTRTDKESRSHVRSDSVGSQTQNGYGKGTTPILRHTESIDSSSCSICHIPYSESSVPFPVKMARCFLCKKSKVPDILLATIDLPPSIQTFGKSCLIQAQVYRPKRDCKGEVSAKEVSDSLPFLEYELHRRLINKLKVRGMNAIFALEVQICLGEKLMVGLATGTAVYVSCLPPSTYPKISAGNLKTDSQKVVQFQKVVQEVYEKNRATYGLKNVAPLHTGDNNQSGSEADDTIIDEDLPDIDLATGNKDTYVLEVDDAEDIDIIQVLIDPSPELGAYTLEPHMNNINFLHGFENCRVVSQQMFTQVWRCRISPLISLRQFTNYFDKLVQAVAFKLRRISPCVLSKLRYRVELPEQDEMQLSIIGLAVRLEEKPKNVTGDITISKTATDNDKEHDLPKSPGNLQPTNGVVPPSNGNTSNVSLDTNASYLTAAHSTTYGTHNVSPSGSIGTNQNPGFRFGLQNKTQLNPPRCIEITPLPHIPGGKIEKYLGNLNFFFIRETTSIRESGGLSGFVHNFIAEVLAIVRAHVAALGGNAMVSYFMTELSLLHNPHKNQGQCLVNIGGDVVRYSVIPNTVQEDL